MFLTRTPILIIARQISLEAQKIIKKDCGPGGF